MGQRGLAWRGDDSHPEGLKTHIRDTHTHPGGSPAAHILTEDVQTLTEVTVDTSVPKDIQTVTPVILPTMRLSKVDSRLVLSEAGQACLVQPPSEKALVVPEQRPTVPQPMPRKKKSAPQTGLLTAPSQPIEMALNVSTGQTHTASDLTHQTPVQVEASTPLAAPEETPTTTTLGVVSTHTVPQTTLKPTEEDMEGVHPAATLVSTETSQYNTGPTVLTPANHATTVVYECTHEWVLNDVSQRPGFKYFLKSFQAPLPVLD
jgi:hypothetical protein